MQAHTKWLTYFVLNSVLDNRFVFYILVSNPLKTKPMSVGPCTSLRRPPAAGMAASRPEIVAPLRTTTTMGKESERAERGEKKGSAIAIAAAATTSEGFRTNERTEILSLPLWARQVSEGTTNWRLAI